MGLGMTVTLVVLLVVAIVAAVGYFMDASVPDDGDEVQPVEQVGSARR